MVLWSVTLITFPRRAQHPCWQGTSALGCLQSNSTTQPFLFCKQYNLQGLLYIIDEKLSQQQISKWDISVEAFGCSGVELFFVQHPIFSNSDQFKDTQTHTHIYLLVKIADGAGLVGYEITEVWISWFTWSQSKKPQCFRFIGVLAFVSRKEKERGRKDKALKRGIPALGRTDWRGQRSLGWNIGRKSVLKFKLLHQLLGAMEPSGMEPSGMEPWWGTHVVPPGGFTLSRRLGMPQQLDCQWLFSHGAEVQLFPKAGGGWRLRSLVMQSGQLFLEEHTRKRFLP